MNLVFNRITTHAATAVLLAALLSCPPSPAAAQQPDLTNDSVALALVAIIDQLPGRPVPLETLVDDALVYNLNVTTARLFSGIATADLTEAKGIFDPALSLFSRFDKDPRSDAPEFASYGVGLSQRLAFGTELGLDVFGDRSAFAFGAAPGSETYLSGLQLSVSQPILEGFNQADVDVRVARFDEAAAQSSQRRAEELVVAGIELRYVDLQEAEALEAVFQRSVDAAETLAFRNEELFTRDLAAEIDVVTAQSGVALRRTILLAAQRARRDASDALIFDVYGETAATVLAADTLPVKAVLVPLGEVETGDLEVAVQAALGQRQDVDAARQRLEGLSEFERSTRNAVRPALDVFGSLRSGGSGASFDESNGLLDEGVRWSLGLAFSQPVGNRGDRGRQQAATQSVMVGEVNVVRSENRAREQVRLAYRALAWGLLVLEASQEAANLARQQLDGEVRRLDLGLGDSFRLLLTEENLVQAELALVRARFDVARALTELRLASGTTLEVYGRP